MQTNTVCLISLIQGTYNSPIIESESTLVDTGAGESGAGRRNGALVFKGTEFQFRKVKSSGDG